MPPAAAEPGLPAPRPAGSANARQAQSAAAASGPAAATPGDTAPARPARLPLLAELPEALRREMAGLRIGGSVWAEQPEARIVILGGQVYREGDSPAEGLRIEQIRQRSVVFELRGQRFEMPM